MKRIDPETINPHQVTNHYTYFNWTNCMKCGLDFRRENGVKWYWFREKVMYICQDCSFNANIEWVNQYVTWLYDMHKYNKPPTGR